jgi:membrane protein DedA with SNARE-associated domain
MAIGIARIPHGKFLPLNALGAFLWASTIGAVGYLFGHVIETIMGDLKRYELRIIIVLAVLGILMWVFFWKYHRNVPPVAAKTFQHRAL